jgi:hypothetical protein
MPGWRQRTEAAGGEKRGNGDIMGACKYFFIAHHPPLGKSKCPLVRYWRLVGILNYWRKGSHRISVDEAVQCFDNRQAILRNKSYKDRFKLIGKTDFGRNLCIIFQLKPNRVVRIITGWEA